MKMPSTLLLTLIGVSVLAQSAAGPQLQVRILPNKSSYSPNEKVMVKAELTNATSKTLCLPVPDQNCETTTSGWIVTTGEPVSSQEQDQDQFLCHEDGGGATGAKLDFEIRERWIKLPPSGVYVTKAAEAKVTLSQAGDWKLTDSYYPPVGAFNAKYATILEAAEHQSWTQ